MPENRKCFVNNTLIFVTFRTEEGLPFVATPYLKTLLNGILARAQQLYFTTICHGVLMANHVHLLLVVEDPQAIPKFVEYIKRESSHAINKLLGRKQRTVWADGYDSPIILDAQKAMDTIVYLYTNPQRANLVEKIEEYPNLNTWEVFSKGGSETKHKQIPRHSIPVLPKKSMGLKDQNQFANELLDNALAENTLYIEPDAWMGCFLELDDCNPEEINQAIIERVRVEENTLIRERVGNVLGTHALQLQDIRKSYTPTKYSKRMLCLSTQRRKRKNYIRWFKEFSEFAYQAIQRIKAGDYSAVLPPGFFLPGGFLHTNINPALAPVQ